MKVGTLLSVLAAAAAVAAIALAAPSDGHGLSLESHLSGDAVVRT